MVAKPATKTEVVEKLHNFILQHNKDIGLRHGMSESELEGIMEDQSRANKVLCEHIYDMLVLEGYLERR